MIWGCPHVRIPPHQPTKIVIWCPKSSKFLFLFVEIHVFFIHQSEMSRFRWWVDVMAGLVEPSKQMHIKDITRWLTAQHVWITVVSLKHDQTYTSVCFFCIKVGTALNLGVLKFCPPKNRGCRGRFPEIGLPLYRWRVHVMENTIVTFGVPPWHPIDLGNLQITKSHREGTPHPLGTWRGFGGSPLSTLGVDEICLSPAVAGQECTGDSWWRSAENEDLVNLGRWGFWENMIKPSMGISYDIMIYSWWSKQW